MIERTYVAFFVGGPLDGETREVSRVEYQMCAAQYPKLEITKMPPTEPIQRIHGTIVTYYLRFRYPDFLIYSTFTDEEDVIKRLCKGYQNDRSRR